MIPLIRGGVLEGIQFIFYINREIPVILLVLYRCLKPCVLGKKRDLVHRKIIFLRGIALGKHGFLS